MRLILASSVRRQRSPECRTQLPKTLAPVSQQRIVVTAAHRRQHGANAIHQGHPLCDEFCSLPDGAPGILVALGGDRHHRAYPRFAAQPGQQGAQQQLGVDPIGLGASCPAIYWDARWLDNVGLDPVCRQPPCQPEPGPTCFVGGDHSSTLPAGSLGPRPVARTRCPPRFGRGVNRLFGFHPLANQAPGPPAPNFCCSAQSKMHKSAVEIRCDRMGD